VLEGSVRDLSFGEDERTILVIDCCDRDRFESLEVGQLRAEGVQNRFGLVMQAVGRKVDGRERGKECCIGFYEPLPAVDEADGPKKRKVRPEEGATGH